MLRLRITRARASEAQKGVPLASLIKELRHELLEAIAEGEVEGSGLRFLLGPVELDLEMQVTFGAGAEGGVQFWVVSAEASAKTRSARSQRIHLTLNPPTSDVQITEHGKPG